MAYYPYINGVSYPKVEIISATGTLIETIEFPLCMENGLIEDYTEDFKRIELHSGEYVDYNFKGSRIRFEMDYSSFCDAETVLKIEKIFYYNTLPNQYKIYMIPRNDMRIRRFEVRLEDGKFNLGVLRGGVNAPGNRNMVIKFITKIPQGKNMQQVTIPVIIFNTYLIAD